MRPIIVAVALLLAPPLAAQGWIEPPPGRPDLGIVKLRTTVSVRITGRVALVEVEEWFENRGGGLGEGDYLYPLPGEAVFSSFSLFQDDRELRGETMDAATARRIYEEIVRRKKDPALIELVGHGLIRSRIFPINPGERRKIRLKYTQVLDRAGDAYVLRYAAGTATGGRPHPLLARDAVRRVPSTPLTFSVRIDEGGRFRDPFSPTHDVHVTRLGNRLTVRPESELNGDFSLFLPFAERLVGISVATHKPAGEHGYFMLTLSPRSVEGAALPRDVTAVVDVSGSMSGEKLEQAKAALHQLLGSLTRRDRFRLVAFSSRVRTYRRAWTSVSADAVAEARQWIDGLVADGGTNIEGALREAFAASDGTERLSIILFLTDGLPSVGEQDPERLASQAEAARNAQRVFAFGVGYDVNTFLLDRLSAAGRGATQYVAPGEDVEAAVGSLIRKVRRPVLTDLALASLPVEVEEIYPEILPDLFANDELVVFGRYRIEEDARGDVVISGRRRGRTERFAATVDFPQGSEAHAYIPRLWAARKLGYLSRQARLHGATDELVAEIKQTALRYGLLSEYTSYFVQEPEVLAQQPLLADRLASVVGGRQDAPAMSGAGAVTAAERARARREVRTKTEADEAQSALADVFTGTTLRQVAGRLFTQTDGRWTDQQHSARTKTVKIAPFSDAYFRLLERLPELVPYVKALDDVLVTGERVSIWISEDGETQLSPRALTLLARDFRGS